MTMTGNLQKRGNRYFFRRRIPADLQSHYPTKTLLVSLGTTEYETAKRRASELTAKTNREFAELRGVRSDEWEAPVRLTSVYLSREELENAEGWEQEYAANRDYHDAIDSVLREARETTDKLLGASGLPTIEQLTIAREISSFQDSSATSINKTRRDVTRLDAPAHLKNLRHVVPSWAARNAPKENAKGRTEKAIDLFEEACGVIPLREIRKTHGAAFVRFLLDGSARGFGRKTAANHAACITALLNVAVKDDLIDRNPLDLTFDKTIGAEKREPWTDAELKLMYGHALFSDQIDMVPEWQGVKPIDGRALLSLLQHTGARIGEIAQLRRGDFQVRDGITTIRITAEAGTVKTKESERTVPLAHHLLADPWFCSWLASIMDGKRADAVALSSMAGRARGPADTAVQWFRQFRAAVGLPAGALNGAHRFRHWIRSALAAKNVGVETADAITGHAAQGSSGRVDYTSIPVSVILGYARCARARTTNLAHRPIQKFFLDLGIFQLKPVGVTRVKVAQ
jgi:integrase